ncbi:MAG: peptidoglycan-binding protein [Hyphomonadaceae bacterium]|nr:peptidoglycan-binding protein [Hyphomonadaceae bacterium]MCA8886039.1 peptidoglycan-binding protein [Hyphomonadaceae bacterium]
MKHQIALAALAAALALTSPAFAGTGASTPAPASRQAQIEHHPSGPQSQAIEDLYRRAQQKLVDMHLYSGAVDGQRGDAFVQSLKQFQRAHNIRATGRLNSETRAALGI